MDKYSKPMQHLLRESLALSLCLLMLFNSSVGGTEPVVGAGKRNDRASKHAPTQPPTTHLAFGISCPACRHHRARFFEHLLKYGSFMWVDLGRWGQMLGAQ